MASLSSTGPGAYRIRPGTIEINADRTVDERRELTVTNTADRPIQVGSHLHLADVNDGLDLDRAQAQGFRLDIAAGTSVRFEPGASKRVAIVALRGRRLVPGIQRRDPGLQNASGTEKPDAPDQSGAEHPDDPEKKDS